MHLGSNTPRLSIHQGSTPFPLGFFLFYISRGVIGSRRCSEFNLQPPTRMHRLTDWRGLIDGCNGTLFMVFMVANALLIEHFAFAFQGDFFIPFGIWGS